MSDPNEAHRIRPYARILTMLGEQLIKNDRIALLELIKNAYDADATVVKIRFDGFGPGLTVTSESTISIEDNGDGMTHDLVLDHWLNPATDVKKRRKQDGQPKTSGGRIIQGEKGIGRFAMFKLGSTVELVTRARDSDSEVVARLDIGFLDEVEDVESVDEPEEADEQPAPPRYLDQVMADVDVRDPILYVASGDPGDRGTCLTIGNLRGTWSSDLLASLHDDVVRLQPLKGLLTGDAGEDPLAFEVSYLIDGTPPVGLLDPQERLDSLVPQAVLRVVGDFDGAANTFDMFVNDDRRQVVADSDDMRALDLYRREISEKREPHQFVCGDFSFELLVFDLRPNIEDARYHLDPTDKKLIKDHRIYLYRDDIRVLPYGDPDDDWLQLDIIRGTVGANRVLSNDQTLGFIYISQECNPGLQDKTNREGLIDSGAAYKDFIALIQLLINYLRREDYQRYLFESKERSDARDRRSLKAIDRRIESLREMVEGVPGAKKAFAEFADAYATERRVMTERVERTEDLAGVGLSVETASHDVVASASQAHREVNILVDQLGYEIGRDHELTKRANAIAISMSFIVSRLQDVQGLFVSTKTRPKDLDVLQYVRKIQAIYGKTLDEARIAVRYEGDLKVSALTHEATLLQVFLNLMDNAIFWLKLSRAEDRTITVTASEASREVVFSDNGPGVKVLDIPYIFDPFFSGKGDEGRGLGLYISRQVASRDNLDLSLVQQEVSPLAESVPAAFRLGLGDQA